MEGRPERLADYFLVVGLGHNVTRLVSYVLILPNVTCTQIMYGALVGGLAGQHCDNTFTGCCTGSLIHHGCWIILDCPPLCPVL